MTREELIAAAQAKSNREDLIRQAEAKYSSGAEKSESDPNLPSPLQTFASSLSPKGLLSSVSGAYEAAPTFLKEGFGKGVEKYRKERDYAKSLLDESETTNPRASSLGKFVGYGIPAALLGPEIPAQMALGGAFGAVNSESDLTKLNQPGQVKRLAGDVGTGLLSGGAGAAAAVYAPVTTAALGLGALGGEMAGGDSTGALTGAALGLLTRGGLAAANPATREFLASKILGNKFKISPEAVSRIEAAQKEGLTPEQIPGFTLTENEEAKRSADALLRSGTFGGSRLRKQVDPYQKALSTGTNDLISEATPKSSYEVGKDVQKGVRQKAESMIAPAAEAYEKLENTYYDEPVSPASIKNVKSRINKLAKEPGLGNEALGIINGIQKDISKVSTIGDLKAARTNIGNQIKKDNFGNVTSDKNALRVISEINTVLTEARDASIKSPGKKPVLMTSEDLNKAGIIPGIEHLGEEEAGARGLWQPWQESEYNYRLNDDLDKRYLVKDGEVVGHVGLRPDGSIKTSYINKDLQGKGLGTEMYQGLVNEGIPFSSDHPSAMEPEATAIWKKLKAKYPEAITEDKNGFHFNPDKIQKPSTEDAASLQKTADSTYKKAAKDLAESLPYGQKGGKGILRPVEKLEQVTPENVRKELALTQDTDLRNAFIKNFPEEAELLRRAELAKISASTKPPQGDLQRNPGRVLSEIFGEPRGEPRYSPQAREYLLGEKVQKAENLKKMYEGLPANFNPSGTASQLSWLESFMHPRETLGSYLQYKKLNFQSPDVKALVDQMAGKMPGKSKAEIVEGLIKKGLLGRRGLITKEN